MKLIALSDTHTYHDKIKLPKGDILIHAGDATFRGAGREWHSFNEWILKQCNQFKHVIFVPGNHDFHIEHFKAYDHPNNFHLLIDEEIVIDGIKFYGSPWTPIFGNWTYMLNEEGLAEKFKLIPDDTDVLITHGAPYGILDQNIRGFNCGSIALNGVIYNHTFNSYTKIHMFGHIHESAGYSFKENIHSYNVSILNEQYKVANKPKVIRIGK